MREGRPYCSRLQNEVYGRAEKEQEGGGEEEGRSELRYFNCGGRGHMSMKCPSKALTCLESSVWHNSKDGPICSGTVEGQSTEDTLLDTVAPEQ